MSWWANWTLKEKFLIRAHLCIIFYILNKDKMADLVIQPRGKIPKKFPYSPNFNAWRCSIAQWSVFIRPYNRRLLTTEKVVDECKAIKLVYKCSPKNCQKLELLDCEKSLLCRSGIVVLTNSHLNTRGGWENLRKLCKPETQSRVLITFKKFSNLLVFQWENVNTEKRFYIS